MRVLVLNPYHGGSHAAFVEGWRQHSRHDMSVLTLPAHSWKWRMRHAAIDFAERAGELAESGERFDALWCTGMMNLAEFRGMRSLAPAAVRDLPAVVYFHENQLTYPDDHRGERDLHFGFTHLVSAAAADAVWFNSAYHRDALLTAWRTHLARMPDRRPTRLIDAVAAKSTVQPPGVELIAPEAPRADAGPLLIAWAARWEHDKDPATFFDALRLLVERGVDFRVDVMGQSFDAVPPCFDEARAALGERVGRWGEAERADYCAALREADVFVSTARHEFFGIAAVEAAAAGCAVVVPRALAYPEVLGDAAAYHDGTPASVAAVIERLAADPRERRRLGTAATRCASRYGWEERTRAMDSALDAIV